MFAVLALLGGLVSGCATVIDGSKQQVTFQSSPAEAEILINGVVVGKRCLFAAQVGIGGKTSLGDEVVLYGQVGIIHNLVIGDKVIVLAGAGVNKNLEGGKVPFECMGHNCCHYR